MDDRDCFNTEAEYVLLDALGESGSIDADPYPDSDEARAFADRLAEAEALGVDPSTLDLLDSGDLEL